MSGSDAAAAMASDIEATKAAAVEQGEQYLRLRLATFVLRGEVERFVPRPMARCCSARASSSPASPAAITAASRPDSTSATTRSCSDSAATATKSPSKR